MKEYGHEFAEIWHHLPGVFEKSGGLQLIRIGLNQAKPNYRVGPRHAHHYSLHFVLEGQIKYTTGDRDYMADSGDVFCLFPGTLCSYGIYHRETPLRMFWITFKGKQSSHLLHLIGMTAEACILKGAITPQVSQMIKNISSTISQHTTRQESLTLPIQIYQLFEALMSLREQEQEQNPAIHEPSSWINKSVEYIEAHYKEDISVEDVAHFVGLNRSHFSRTFTKKIKKTPNQYIDTLRLQEADRLLRKTKMSISEIAYSIGYNDSYSFARAYKKSFGVPPSNNRRLQH